MCTQMFTGALFVVANWELFRSPSTGDSINKLWYIHTIEFMNGILFINKNDELFMCATIWMKFKIIILSIRSQTKKRQNTKKLYLYKTLENAN